MVRATVIEIFGNLTGVTASPAITRTGSRSPICRSQRHLAPSTGSQTAGGQRGAVLRASVWRDFAEHVASRVSKGSRVTAQGHLKQ